MKTLDRKKLKAKPISGMRRGTVAATQENWITIKPLLSDRHIPMLIEPRIDGMNLIEWGRSNRGYLRRLLDKYRALLFRNFNISNVDDFESFVTATSDGTLLEYRDRTTPRHSEGGSSERVYISTIYPPEHSINPHNEGSYWLQWARKLYFCSLETPEQGGETPIFDVRRVFDHIPVETRNRFVEKNWMLVRNYNDGFGLTWQEVYQTDDKAEVEAYCRDNAIKLEWHGDERLRTKSVRKAVHEHPDTGEKVWFNHAAFYHHTSLEPEMRKALLSEFELDELPYSTFFGDGSEIPIADINAIKDAYDKEKVVFPWQRGDILLLDNTSIAHGREPYVGNRRTVVAMTEPISDVR